MVVPSQQFQTGVNQPLLGTPRVERAPHPSSSTQVPPQTQPQTPVAVEKEKSSSGFLIAIAIFLFIILVTSGGAFWYLTGFPPDPLVIPTQPLGEAILVDKLIMKKPGFLIIYTRGSLGEAISPIVGVPYIEKGTYSFFEIGLVSPEFRPEIQAGDLLKARIILDSNGNKEYEDIDPPYRDPLGNIVEVDFRIE